MALLAMEVNAKGASGAGANCEGVPEIRAPDAELKIISSEIPLAIMGGLHLSAHE